MNIKRRPKIRQEELEKKRKNKHFKTTFDYNNNSHYRGVYLTQVSKNSKAILNNLVNSMNSTFNYMTIKYNDNEIISNNLSRIIFEKSKRIGRELKRLTKINEQYNLQFRENYSDKNENSSVKKTKRTYKSNLSEIKKNILDMNCDSKSGIFGFESEKSSESSLDTINKEREQELFLKTREVNSKINKIEKLSNLKSQIIMDEQRKKYSLKKETIEITKEIPQGNFFRDVTKNFAFQPFNLYNKDQIFYNKKYTHETQLDSNIDNEILQGKKSNLKHGDYCFLKNSNHLQYKFKPLKRNLSLKQKLTINTTTEEFFKNNSAKNLFFKSEKKVQFQKRKSHVINKSIFNKSFPNKITNQKLFSQSLKNITKMQNIIFKENKKLNKHFNKKFTPEIKKKKKRLNLEEIKDDIKQNYIEKKGNEKILIKQNAKKVEKILDENGKKILWNIVNSMILNDDRSDKEFEMKTLWDRRLSLKRQNKEFKKIGQETTILEQKLNINHSNDYKNEKKKIDQLMKTVFDYNFDDVVSLNQMLYKSKILKIKKHLIPFPKKKINQKKSILKNN